MSGQIGDDGRVSTLLLAGEKEFVLSASEARVRFDNCHRHDEVNDAIAARLLDLVANIIVASLSQNFQEQTLTLTLENAQARHVGDQAGSSVGTETVPIIVTPPSTGRFELLSVDAVSSPFECILRPCSSKMYTVRFRRPAVSESDYAWDNFQDQVVVHTRLSRLVIRLEAWKFEAPTGCEHGHDSGGLFPASLPDVKAPPLKLFNAIERQRATQSRNNETLNALEPASEIRTSRAEFLPPLSRPSSRDREPSPLLSSRASLITSSTDKIVQLPCPSLTDLQLEREAREVILRLRCRRTVQRQTNTMNTVQEAPAIESNNDLSPETEALNAKTKAELDAFNGLVIAARDQVAKDAAQAKNDLAYYQHILLDPQSKTIESRTDAVTTQKPTKTRQLPTVKKRPSKLPSLSRPSSNSSITAELATTNLQASGSNQDVSLDKIPEQQRSSCPKMPVPQQIPRASKLKSLPRSRSDRQRSNQACPKMSNKAGLTEQQQGLNRKVVFGDFDDHDPAVDEAPVVPDDLAGVATLEDDDMHV